MAEMTDNATSIWDVSSIFQSKQHQIHKVVFCDLEIHLKMGNSILKLKSMKVNDTYIHIICKIWYLADFTLWKLTKFQISKF